MTHDQQFWLHQHWQFAQQKIVKGLYPVQLLFGRDMILPIKHNVDWELISQQNQAQINKYNIRGNIKIDDHTYNVGYKVMLNNNAAYKYEIPYRVTEG